MSNKYTEALEIDVEPWYTMASKQEVYNTLNTIAMGFETYHNLIEEGLGTFVRKYDFDGNTFYKAEQLWAEREGLC